MPLVQAPRLSTCRLERHAHRRMPASSLEESKLSKRAAIGPVCCEDHQANSTSRSKLTLTQLTAHIAPGRFERCMPHVQAPRLSTCRFERHAHRRMPASSQREQALEESSCWTSLLRGSSGELHSRSKLTLTQLTAHIGPALKGTHTVECQQALKKRASSRREQLLDQPAARIISELHE